MALTTEELEQLRDAKRLIEAPSFAARLTDLLGRPIEKSVGLLPDKATKTVHAIVRTALERSLEVALKSMGASGSFGVLMSGDRLHKLATATTGAVGGFFGLAGLAVELPLTTTIMLRSIGDIARTEGHDLSLTETRLACLEVFALGGKPAADDAAETGYYAVRTTLASLVTDAVRHVAEHGIRSRGGPVLVRLLESIAARFGIVVQQKVALEMIPAIGAVSGALINTVFMGHFQNMARGHFAIKRLEARHGLEVVKDVYSRLEV